MQDIKDQLNRIEAKVDGLDNRQDKIDVHMAVYNEQLKVHIKGVQTAYQRLDAQEARIAPMETKWAKIEGAFKLLGVFGAFIGITVGIVEIINFVLSYLHKP